MQTTTDAGSRQRIQEAIDVLRYKDVRSTTYERLWLTWEADALVQDLPQPRQLGQGLTYLLDHISLPVSAHDLLVGRISEQVPDEEQDLFPLLVRSTLKMAELIHGLKQDHERLDQAWRDIAPMLAQPSHIGDPQQFTVLANNFAELYRDHIAKENEELLDRAQHMLSSEQLKKIGKAMKERRQRPAEEDW